MRIVKDPEERRMELIDIAAALFARQGFVKTTVAEIVEKADVAKGLFYYYFPSKDDMVKAVMEKNCMRLEEAVRNLPASRGNTETKIQMILKEELLEKYLPAPVMKDLRLPQNAALYSDMCDRVTAHLLPTIRELVQETVEEMDYSQEQIEQIAGIAIYGMLMMMRQEKITPEEMRKILNKMIPQMVKVA